MAKKITFPQSSGWGGVLDYEPIDFDNSHPLDRLFQPIEDFEKSLKIGQPQFSGTNHPLKKTPVTRRESTGDPMVDKLLDNIFGKEPDPEKLDAPKLKHRNLLGKTSMESLPSEIPSKIPSSIVDVENANVPTVTTPDPLDPFGLMQRNREQTQEQIDRQKVRQAGSSMINSLGNVVSSLFSAYGANQGAPITATKSTRPQDKAREDALFEMEMSADQQANAQELQIIMQEYNRAADKQKWLEQFGKQQEAIAERQKQQYEHADTAQTAQNKFTVERDKTQAGETVKRDKFQADVRMDQILASNTAAQQMYTQRNADLDARYRQGHLDDITLAQEKSRLQDEIYQTYGKYNPNSYQSNTVTKPYQEVKDSQGKVVGLSELEAGEVSDWINEQRKSPIATTTGEGKKAKTTYAPALPGLSTTDPKNTREAEAEVRRYYKDYLKATEQAPVESPDATGTVRQERPQSTEKDITAWENGRKKFEDLDYHTQLDLSLGRLGADKKWLSLEETPQLSAIKQDLREYGKNIAEYENMSDEEMERLAKQIRAELLGEAPAQQGEKQMTK